MSDADPVEIVTTPIRLEYDYRAGTSSRVFLRGLEQKRLIGARAGNEGPVYLPPRGADPKSARITDQFVEVRDTGTVVTFSIVRVPSPNLDVPPPYACISVLLDGADLSLFHILKGCDLEDVRIGMRVRAVWAPDEELTPSIWSIRYFEPLDEPDVAPEQLREYS